MNKPGFLRPAVLTTSLTTAALAAPLAVATDHEIAQQNKQFTQTELTIKVGDTVHFPNQDPFFHNVYSLSASKMFDLGSYKQGESKSVTFEEAGTVDVECAIHPMMRTTITVEN